MAEPSQYELDAWADVQAFNGRQVSRAMGAVGQKVSQGTEAVGDRASNYLEKHPHAQKAVERGREAAAKGTRAIGKGAQAVGDFLPGWVGSAGGSVQRTA